MMGFLDPRIWLMVAGLAVAGYGLGRWHQYQHDSAAHAKATLEALEKAEAEYQVKLKIVEGQVDEQRKRVEAAQRSATNARGELGKLRDIIARAQESAASAPGTDDSAATASELLGECSERYQALGEEAGRLANQVIGLQQYVRQVCVSQ